MFYKTLLTNSWYLGIEESKRATLLHTREFITFNVKWSSKAIPKNKVHTFVRIELLLTFNEYLYAMYSNFFQAPKNTPDEVAAAASSCFKLNSLQLQCLLMKYQYEPEEIPIPPEVLDNVVRVSVQFCIYIFLASRMEVIEDSVMSSWVHGFLQVIY